MNSFESLMKFSGLYLSIRFSIVQNKIYKRNQLNQNTVIKRVKIQNCDKNNVCASLLICDIIYMGHRYAGGLPKSH